MTELAPDAQGPLWWQARDGLTILRRDLLHLKHNPMEIASNLIFPIVLVVLFGYVFGSAIKVPGGGSYRSYLMPGLFAMSQVSAMGTLALAVADDAAKGIMDRLRSMPMARLAVPFGRTLADLASGLLVLFRYALAWLGAYLGLMVKNPTTADALVPLSFPVSMLANTFVSPAGMPAWLRVIADWNPVSALVSALRELLGNPGATTASAPLPLQHPIITTLLWCAALIAIFTPLATWRYGRTR
jgi:ABC-2 type transport system permease protein